MFKKKLLKRLSRRELEFKVMDLKNTIDHMEQDMDYLEDKQKYDLINIRDAAKRDYLVRTKYLGKLKDKNIIKDFKKEIEETTRYSFEEACNFIRDYRFIVTRVGGMKQVGEETSKIYILEEFSFILEQYENKQVVLDDYWIK